MKGPMVSALKMVPMPGRWRSGIQNSSTITLAMMLAVPMVMSSWKPRPWWNASHGPSPRLARTNKASPRPHSRKPENSISQRCGATEIRERIALAYGRARAASMSGLVRYMLAPHIATPPFVTPDSRESGVIRGPWMGLAPSGEVDPGSRPG